MDGGEAVVGMESLRRLKSTDAPLFLSPSEELAEAARIASQYLFSALKPFSSNCPLPHLVTNGFDAEQIWPQVEVQSEPLIKNLRNQLRKMEKNPEEITKQFNLVSFDKKDEKTSLDRENGLEKESKGDEGDEGEEEEEFDDDDDEDDDEEEEEENEDEDGEDIDEEEEEEEEEEDKGKGKGKENGVEDKFLKIKELEEYLEFDEAREYGSKDEKKTKRKRGGDGEDTDEDEEEDDDDEDGDGGEEDDDELELLGMDDGEDDEEDAIGNARYEDFFGVQKKTSQKKKSKLLDGSDDSDMDDGPVNDKNNQKKQNLSTHEKEQEKLRSQIEQMEKSNLDPKDWTMRGEITADKRAKNSALEVDLDFEHNVRPAPVITEEVTASLEELIQKRILEGRFDDVQRASTLPSRARKEVKEMDENKSKKGLAEVYEEEYVQKTGLVSTALTFSDEQKKEASMLFKKLCLKLDALSHFHFTPKPVIEDMSIQANVPALAMEEIAPVAVSDASMLAPEEVFAGKGDIKEETELSQAERKRRRAKKKRKFKAESVQKLAKKAQQSVPSNRPEGNEDS